MNTERAFEKFFDSTDLDKIELDTISMDTFKRALKLAYQEGCYDRLIDIDSRFYLSAKGKNNV